MSCEKERAVRDALQTALDRASQDHWEAFLNVVGAGLTTVVSAEATIAAAAGTTLTFGALSPTVVISAGATLAGLAWFGSAAIGLNQAIDDLDAAENAFEAAEDAYCDCLRL